MSTKIYNGVRIDTGNIFDFTRKLRETLTPVRTRAQQAHIANEAVSHLDRRTLGLPEPTCDAPWGSDPAAANDIAHLIRIVASNLMHAQVSMRANGKIHDWEYDPHRFELSIGQDPETGVTVGIFYCEDENLRDAFLAMCEVEDFHYQNQTDRPKEITSEDWELRRQVWDRVLPGLGVPAEQMLTFKLDTVPWMDLHSLDVEAVISIINSIPVEQRGETRFLDLARIRYTQERKDIRISELMKIRATDAGTKATERHLHTGLAADSPLPAPADVTDVMAEVDAWWEQFREET